MLVRIANREDHKQTAFQKPDLGLRCLSMPFWQAVSFRNVRTFAVVNAVFPSWKMFKNNANTCMCVIPVDILNDCKDILYCVFVKIVQQFFDEIYNVYGLQYEIINLICALTGQRLY